MLNHDERVIEEMLEPNGEFRSRLEWLANWLDKTDAVFIELKREGVEIPGISEYLWNDETYVQDDLRRWARELRGES